jgi:peptidoglycan hydrolase-like protein with peptidoglycan-binding domain
MEAYYWYRLADANGDGKASDRAELVVERLTPEERGDVNRRVSAFIAANITGKRQRTLPPAPPAPPAPPTPVPAAPVTDAPKAATPKADTQTAAPPAGPPTNTERVRRIQAQLKSLSFEPGPADGSLGGQTRDAIRIYQRALGLDVNGEPSEALLTHLRQISGFRK